MGFGNIATGSEKNPELACLSFTSDSVVPTIPYAESPKQIGTNFGPLKTSTTVEMEFETLRSRRGGSDVDNRNAAIFGNSGDSFFVSTCSVDASNCGLSSGETEREREALCSK